MYITSRYLCFYSNLFGLEKKIRIPFSHIKEITKENTALVIPNALSVTTFRKEYLFRSFWDRDECFQVLRFVIDKQKDLGRGSMGPSPLVTGRGASASYKGVPITNGEIGAALGEPGQNQMIEETKAGSKPIVTQSATTEGSKATVPGSSRPAGRRTDEGVFRETGSMKVDLSSVVPTASTDDVHHSMEDILDEGNESGNIPAVHG
jgi:hypothetical protein